MTAEQARALLASLPEGASPGPWANVGYPLRGIDGPEIMGPGDQLLCTMDNHPNDLANAALIAAAPALRDALVAALDRESELRSLAENARSVAEGMALAPSTGDGEAVAFACVAAILTPGGSDV